MRVFLLGALQSTWADRSKINELKQQDKFKGVQSHKKYHKCHKAMPWWRVSIPHLSYISTYLPNLSTHPPTHPYTHPPTHLPIHPSIHPPIKHPSTYPPTHPLTAEEILFHFEIDPLALFLKDSLGDFCILDWIVAKPFGRYNYSVSNVCLWGVCVCVCLIIERKNLY